MLYNPSEPCKFIETVDSELNVKLTTIVFPLNFIDRKSSSAYDTLPSTSNCFLFFSNSFTYNLAIDSSEYTGIKEYLDKPG